MARSRGHLPGAYHEGYVDGLREGERKGLRRAAQITDAIRRQHVREGRYPLRMDGLAVEIRDALRAEAKKLGGKR